MNDAPWNGAGASSLRKADYPAYVERGIESARGRHALRLLDPDGQPRRDFTLESLMQSAFDSYLPWFARTIPALTAAYDAAPRRCPAEEGPRRPGGAPAQLGRSLGRRIPPQLRSPSSGAWS